MQIQFTALKRAARTGLVLAAFILGAASSRAAKSELVLVGSGKENISAFWLDLETGALRSIGEVAKITAPSFIAVSPNQKYLYAITEVQKDPVVNAYRLDGATGHLDLINSQPTGGTGPCFVQVDPKGKDVLVANYTGGSVSAFPIEADGSLGGRTAFAQDSGSSVNSGRQEGPHAHCIVTDPDDKYVFACDLGIDKVMIFKFDRTKGTWEPNDPPSASVKPGSGPRHIAFSPDRRNAYVVNELASTVTAFNYDRRAGTLTEFADYPMLPDGFSGQNYASEVTVDAAGRFVYAANRGNDSIALFTRDAKTGALTFIERAPTGGKFPRSFEIDPTGAFLIAANQDSDSIVVFRIDSKTGRLQPTGNTASSNKPMVVKCLKVAN
jgi:6-phosphogluconolactonase